MPCSFLNIPLPLGQPLCELSLATAHPHARALCRCSTPTGARSTTLRSRRLSGSPRLPRASHTCTPQSRRCTDSTAAHYTAMSAVCSACSFCSDLASKSAIWAGTHAHEWPHVPGANSLLRGCRLCGEMRSWRTSLCAVRPALHAVSQCWIARVPWSNLERKAVTFLQSMACSSLGKAAWRCCHDVDGPPVWASLQHSGMAAGQNLEGSLKKGSSKDQGLQHTLDYESSPESGC